MPEFLDLHGKASKALRALAEADMRRLGLHFGQNHMLALLWDNDGLTPGEIAAALQVTTPTVVKMATRMSSTGLLTRRRDDRDNRLVRLWLTDAGRALRQPVEVEREALERRRSPRLHRRRRARPAWPFRRLRERTAKRAPLRLSLLVAGLAAQATPDVVAALAEQPPQPGGHGVVGQVRVCHRHRLRGQRADQRNVLGDEVRLHR